MDRNLSLAPLPDSTHLLATKRLREDLAGLRDRARRQELWATTHALDLAMDMLSMELDPDDCQIRFDGPPPR